MIDRLFHHKKTSKKSPGTQSTHLESTEAKDPKEESEFQKVKTDIKDGERDLKKHIEKDEAMRREGQSDEYGGLM